LDGMRQFYTTRPEIPGCGRACLRLAARDIHPGGAVLQGLHWARGSGLRKSEER
jgi:hypothetical protein